MKYGPNHFVPMLVLLTVVVPVMIFTCLGISYAKPVGLLATVMILWVSNLIPVAATAILVPCLAINFGILSPAVAFLPFGSGILALFVGVFLLVRAFQKFGLDRRVARIILRSEFATASPARLVFVAALSAWLLGMWMSNTATCAVLLPICLGMLDWSKAHLTKAQLERFSARLLLTCAYTPSIGGMATPVGSVPNALAIEHLAKQGFEISFFGWFWAALPVSLTLLVASVAVLHLLFPLSGCRFRDSFAEGQPLNEHAREQRLLVTVFCIVILLWLAPELAAAVWPAKWLAVETLSNRLPLAVPALLGAISLFVIRVNKAPLLEAKDILRIDWSTILLFGGGLCLGEVLNGSGAAAAFAKVMIEQSREHIEWLPLMIATASTLLSEVSSNTTTASIMVPILTNLFQWMPAERSLILILSSVFAAGLGFMLPISTPPNAMVFGTGRIKLIHMIAAGVILDLIGIATIVGYSFLIIR